MAKVSKAKIVYYELDSSGKNRYIKSNDEMPILHPGVSDVVIAKEPEKNLDVLRGNPFLLREEDITGGIYSVEDFLVTYKKREVPLGDLIRNIDYPVFKRKRILKKAFRKWNREYSKVKNVTFKKNFRSVEVIKGIGNVKFSFEAELLIWFMFAAMLFILGTKSPLWRNIETGRFGLFLSRSLNDMYGACSWIRPLGYFTVYLLIILIFYSVIFRIIMRDYRIYYNKARIYLENSAEQINKEYKTKRKKAYKYYRQYLKKRTSPYFPPLDIKEVREGNVNISVFEDVSSATVNKSYRIMRMEPFLKTVRIILLFGCIAGTLVIYGYSLISVIIAAF